MYPPCYYFSVHVRWKTKFCTFEIPRHISYLLVGNVSCLLYLEILSMHDKHVPSVRLAREWRNQQWGVKQVGGEGGDCWTGKWFFTLLSQVSLLFSLGVFCTAPWQTQCLEQTAIWMLLAFPNLCLTGGLGQSSFLIHFRLFHLFPAFTRLGDLKLSLIFKVIM